MFQDHDGIITSVMNIVAWSCHVPSSTVMVDKDSASSAVKSCTMNYLKNIKF